MGWIKRNWFWYTHHDLYIEPTPEQQEISKRDARLIRRKLGMIMAATYALNGSLDDF